MATGCIKCGRVWIAGHDCGNPDIVIREHVYDCLIERLKAKDEALTKLREKALHPCVTCDVYNKNAKLREELHMKELIEKRLRLSWTEACVEVKQYRQAAEHCTCGFEQALKETD